MGQRLTQLEIAGSDLLDQDVDVNVSVWNRNITPWWLLPPQGVSGAIRKRSANPVFREIAKLGAIPLDGAVITGSGTPGFKAIIHVAEFNTW